MPEDKDFKRLVRNRMTKTGEAYTTARAQLRPPGPGDLRSLTTRTGLDDLAPHLESTYGIEVRETTELDLGVYRVVREDGVPWVARVFPAARIVTQVEDDERLLRFLEQRDLPAERLALDEPISTLEGQSVLVTRYVRGTIARHDTTGPTMLSLGRTLAAVHAIDPEECRVTRPAGGWHHIVPNGGTVRDAAQTLLEELDSSDGSEEMSFVRAQLVAVSDFAEVAQALIHPDPCGANAVVADDGSRVLIDWTGAGRGPRILSLAALLAGSVQPVPGAPASRVLAPLDAIMVGYRETVALTSEELDALPHAITAGWAVLGAWMHLLRDVPIKEIARGMADRLATADRVSRRVRETYDLDDDTLTAWFRPVAPTVDRAQESLF